MSVVYRNIAKGSTWLAGREVTNTWAFLISSKFQLGAKGSFCGEPEFRGRNDNPNASTSHLIPSPTPASSPGLLGTSKELFMRQDYPRSTENGLPTDLCEMAYLLPAIFLLHRANLSTNYAVNWKMNFLRVQKSVCFVQLICIGKEIKPKISERGRK